MKRTEFRIAINVENAAFEDDINAEVARLLRGIADILAGTPQQPGIYRLRDSNGNTCGTWGFK